MIGSRDAVDATGPSPEFGNPGFLLTGHTTPTGVSHRCIACDVRWHGDTDCFVCGQPAYTTQQPPQQTTAQRMATALQAGLRAVDGLAS